MHGMWLVFIALFSGAASAQKDIEPTTGPLAGGHWVYVDDGTSFVNGVQRHSVTYFNSKSLLPVGENGLRFQVAAIGELPNNVSTAKLDIDSDCAEKRYRFVGHELYDSAGKLMANDRKVSEWAYWTGDKARTMDFVADTLCQALAISKLHVGVK